MTEAAEPWWAALYDDAVADVLLVRADPAEVAATVNFLWQALDLRAGARVFDQCCGIGGIAVPLAQRGAQVVGVDQSERYIARAAAAAAAAQVRCQLVAGDAFLFVPDEPCDGAFNWGTSFGNALRDDDNLQMLHRAYAALKPGGHFVLDYQHIARVLLDFQPSIIRRGRSSLPGQPDAEVVLLRESTLKLARGVLSQRWTIYTPDGRQREVSSEVRLYLPHELARLLAAAGFDDVRFHGDLEGGPLLPRSPRCLAVARRRG